MSEHSHFVPPDPELETTEFLQDVASEMFLYQQWLEKVATEQKLDVTGYQGRFFAIPQFLYQIPGIGKDIVMSFSCRKSIGDDSYIFDKVSIATEDYPYPVTITNDHGLYVIEHGSEMSLAPPDAQRAVIEAFFSERDRRKPQTELVDFLAKHSYQSVHESIFETIGENDNSVKVVMIARETDQNSSISLEVTTREQHPSSALVGTRLTMFDSFESAMDADSSLSLLPDTSVNLDVLRGSKDTSAFMLSPLRDFDRSIPISVPKRYHEAHIIEALFALEKAAKSA